ncbi:biosynthetic-type acetolactate synthase large subunit [Clostridium oryzae]|uniref:Acetolactate synthase n=1 Tax=Clostridium oryzae TaxID=1450648 RepID=A0A1V4IKC5_9CLOT|nr:biosynthetic-type acetolactate synthase large subunit [Clostridium oryzae]OPJ60386.1 acetolactate synthase large subunit [Clostridium oryzae]
MKLNGAQLILQCLKEQGVDTVFGYPGGQVIPLYDALYYEKEINHILVAHEQGASHAADGYARASGKTGVVFATSGPGATNTVTGIATAFADSVPMVVITGQVPRSSLGKDSFQEVNIISITKAITKKNYLVKTIEEIPQAIAEAFFIAKAGRPGPVLIDIPKDLQVSFIEYNGEGLKYRDRFEQQDKPAAINEDDIDAAVKLINSSKKPMIYAGGGIIIAEAHNELIQLAEKINAPTTTTMMGTGSFPNDHKLFTGMVGMHGSHASNLGVTNCDLLISLGVRFSDRVASHVQSFAPNAKIIHVDIDPKEIRKNVRVDAPIIGDVKEVLTKLIPKIEERAADDWNEKVNEWEKEYPLHKNFINLSPKYIINKVCELTEGNVTVTTEVGQHQIWACQYFNYKYPRTFISSGGMGTMGYGLGAAIGATYGNPDRKVVNIAGDGSFKMNCNELATLSRYKRPVIQVVFNNHALGMVRQWQNMFNDGRLSFTLFGDEVDFVKLGEAYGIKGRRATNEQEVEEALKYALSLNEPFILDCIINEEDNVMPMVAPGAPIDQIIYEE